MLTHCLYTVFLVNLNLTTPCPRIFAGRSAEKHVVRIPDKIKTEKNLLASAEMLNSLLLTDPYTGTSLSIRIVLEMLHQK